MKKFANLIILSFFALALSSITLAQGTTSRFTGTVRDNAGASVAGANVTLTNEGTNISISTQTGDDGNYTFDLIQIGVYTVTVEKAGFKKFVSKNNTVNINQPATVRITLETGDVAATVTVESTAETVQTSSSGNIGSTVEQRTLESLPIVGTRGRNPLDLLNYQPGIVNGANTGGGVHINGSRDRSFNFTLDGIDINESTAGGSNFTPLRPNPDSLQEFQVVTSGFTAELGRSSGAQVTFVTRSGTNKFKGNLFEYYQTPRFQSRSYAANVNNQAKEQFVQHIYGGSLGGPLFNLGFGEGTKPGFLRDKAFFFVNLQKLRAYDSSIVTRTVYTAQARQGLFRWIQGGINAPAGSTNASVDTNGNAIIPACTATVTTNCTNTFNIGASNARGLDPKLMAFLNAMPLPNNFTLAGDGLNTAAYVFSSPQAERQYDFVSKFDFKISDNSAVYIRYAQGEQNTLGDAANGGRPRFPTSGNFVDTFRTPKNFAANWRWSPSAKFTNEFLFGVSRFGFSFTKPNPNPNYPFVFNLPTDSDTNFNYNARSFRTLQFIDNLTFDLSPHTVKAGINFRLGRGFDDRSSVAGSDVDSAITFSRTINSNFAPFAGIPTGTAIINSADRTRLESMINDQFGRVGAYSRAFVSDPNNPGSFAPAGTRWENVAKYPELDFYVQDNWRVKPNFVLDLGVRWELKLTPKSGTGRPILRPNQPFILGSAATNNLKWTPRELFPSDYKVFLPSVGFAWDPFKTGKTSIRVNYRMASDRFGTQFFGASIFQSAPGNTFFGTDANAFGSAGGLLRDGLPSITPTSSPSILSQPAAFGVGSINVIDPSVQFPRIHSWTLSFQREFMKDNVIEVNYIGKKGTHLLGGYDANQVNINAKVNGISESFLEAFNQIRTNAAYNSPLINFLLSGNATNNNGTARFRLINAAAITQGSVATLAFQTSQRLCTTADITSAPVGTTPICTTAQVGQRLLDITGNSGILQPFSQFTGGLFVTDSNDRSMYHGVEAIFKRRMNKGLSFQLAYTWAVSKDSRSFDPVFTTVATGTSQTAANTPFDNLNQDLNYSWSDFDRRHSFQGTYVYELPFGNGKWIGGNAPNALKYVISGWQLAGGIRLTSGRPFTVFSGLNTFSNTVGSTAVCSSCPRNLGNIIQADPSGLNLLRNWYFSQEQLALFSQPLPGQQGTTPRNYFIGPRFFETDVSLLKKFKITERLNFDLRVDAKNLTNTPNFNAPSAVFPANGSLTGSLFGRINADVTNSARRIQISGKINF
jgi:Carboxypeptidase regulatory-like domain